MRKFADHPLQSQKWGEFREKTGVKVVRKNGLQVTIHPIPHTSFTIGYLPKCDVPDEKMVEELKHIGKTEKCIFIQIEPNAAKESKKGFQYKKLGLKTSARPLFTKFNLILDITKSEEELLKNFSQKTRYNVRLAQKKGVTIEEDNSPKAFNEYLKLMRETTNRQGFFAHSENYHKKMWETLYRSEGKRDELTAHLFLAKYQKKVLTAWILFVYNEVLYYPYGASSNIHREVMASNLMMWEAIKYGKKLGLKKFDLWGALGENPDPKDPWFGFHKFKLGYNPKLVEYLGSFDLVIQPSLYRLFVLGNKLRWLLLRLKRVK